MKIASTILSLIFLFAMSFTGCAEKPAEKTAAENKATASLPTVKMVLPAGAPVLAVAPLIVDEQDHIDTEIIASPPLLPARVIGGEADAAIVPSNLAAALFNRGVDVKVAAGVVWGILYVVSRSDKVAKLADLRGKELTLFGRGLTPDIIFRHLLEKAKVAPETDLTLNYLAGGSEAAAGFIAGQSDYVLVAEPAVTKALQTVPGSRVGVDLQKEWANQFGSGSYPQAVVLLVGDKWSNTRLTDDFITRLKSAVGADIEEAVAAALPLMPEYSEKLLLAAYQRCNIAFRNDEGAKTALMDYYRILFDSDPQTVGGKLPDNALWR